MIPWKTRTKIDERNLHLQTTEEQIRRSWNVGQEKKRRIKTSVISKKYQLKVKWFFSSFYQTIHHFISLSLICKFMFSLDFNME
jgi:hypothetical protein